MALDPELFQDFRDVGRGDRVRYATKDRHGEIVRGVGVVRLVWLGVEEMCEIGTPEGGTVNVCRAIGDTVERVADPPAP